jgi:hypothetical protein
MPHHVLSRYRCVRPLFLYGRILSTNEIVKLPPADAAEHVDSGHLVAVAIVNGETPSRQWTVPQVREAT